jgi:hypothetical protein
MASESFSRRMDRSRLAQAYRCASWMEAMRAKLLMRQFAISAQTTTAPGGFASVYP